MRTPTIVCLSALASAAIAAPTALVAHDYLSNLDLGSISISSGNDSTGTNGQSGSVAPQVPGSSGDGSSSSGTGAATSSGSGTSTRATSAQSRGVVMIDTVMTSGEGAGSGMVLTTDGTVLTNYHVVSGSTQIRVTVPNGRSYTADVVGHDQSHDVAVLKLRGASGLSTVTLDTDGVRTAESVLAVGQGNGEGVLFAATGKVLSINAQITAKDDTSLATSETLTGLIRIDAPIVPGYSGGPLFDAAGKVVGIDTAASAANSLAGYSSTSAGDVEGFAIPITSAKSIADDILAGHKTATNHLGARAALGVSVAPSRTGEATGITVQGVVSGQGAADAGITQGSVITSVAGTAITDSTALSHVMDRQNPGAKVKVTWRDLSGTQHTATVTLSRSSTN